MNRYLLFLSGFLSLTCSEVLPPRDDPGDVLAPSLRAEYSLTPQSDGVGVTAKFTNIFDETLQGQLSIAGEFVITWDRFSDVKKIARLSSRNLAFARNYNGLTGELTINPGDSVTVTYFWSIMADSEAVLRNWIFLFNQDPTCRFIRQIALRESFSVTGNVRLFRNTAPIDVGRTEVSFCLISRWVDGLTCPPPPPCSTPESARQGSP